jgi:hypothetical protein
MIRIRTERITNPLPYQSFELYTIDEVEGGWYAKRVRDNRDIGDVSSL